MKRVERSVLQGLPAVVARLVRDGVYSLYTVIPSSGGAAGYVLVTDRNEIFLLDEQGVPQDTVSTGFDEKSYGEPVQISDDPASLAPPAMHLNWA